MNARKPSPAKPDPLQDAREALAHAHLSLTQLAALVSTIRDLADTTIHAPTRDYDFAAFSRIESIASAAHFIADDASDQASFGLDALALGARP